MKKKMLVIGVFIIVLLSFSVLIKAKTNKNRINIILYGLDGRKENEVERSDAIILINFNYDNNKIITTSIPRDSRVQISCKDNEYDKINHSFAYGGKECLNETVKKLFDIQSKLINVVIEFDDVVDIVDFFGLIEIIPSYSFCQSDENFEKKYCFEKGKKTLIDGKQALAYMRNRKSLPNGDFDRTGNQRQILRVLLEKSLNLSLIDKIKFFNSCKKIIDTDLEYRDINFSKIIRIQQIQLEEYTLEGESYYYNEHYYYKLNKDSLEKIKKYYI